MSAPWSEGRGSLAWGGVQDHLADRALADDCVKSGDFRLVDTEPKSVARFLRRLAEPSDAPLISAARDPPCFTSRAVRRAVGELDPALREEAIQGELF